MSGCCCQSKRALTDVCNFGLCGRGLSLESLVSHFYTSGASFLSSFISAAKNHEEEPLIKMCGDVEVKTAVFEAVRIERPKSLEFLAVSCPEN